MTDFPVIGFLYLQWLPRVATCSHPAAFSCLIIWTLFICVTLHTTPYNYN